MPKIKPKQKTLDSTALMIFGGGMVVVLGAALLIGLLGQGAPLAVPAVEAIPRTSAAEAKAAQESGNAIILDVRDPDSYEASHIPGALLIPLTELQQRLKELDKEKWIITYCT